MSHLAANNPLARKFQQEAGKRISNFAIEQVAKHTPKAIEAGEAFLNGVRGGAAPQGGVNRAAHEAGGLARDMATDQPKKDFQKGVETIAHVEKTVTNMVTQQPKPTASPNAPKPGAEPRGMPKMGGSPVRVQNINANLKPMKPIVPLNKPTPKVANVNQYTKPRLGRTKSQLERE
jgi:hypothetical protein